MNQQDEYAHFTGEIEEPSASLADHPVGCLCSGCVLEGLLERAFASQKRLNSTRDTRAIQASVAGTRMILDAIRPKDAA